MSPRFSILIPTRDRPATFRHTLATVASQPGDDYEIVVADNCSSPETRMIVESVDSTCLRYLRSDEILPMAENWERGLAACSGEYVTVLGDDDGFLPSTLACARRLLDATAAEIAAWLPHTYWWPDTIVHWERNLLHAHLGAGAHWVDSREALLQCYRDASFFSFVPMIYNAFFHRGLIERARKRLGAFFVPPDTAPDVASGILGLHLSQRYAFSSRPLSVRGNSGKSNGCAQMYRSLGARQIETYVREERVGLARLIHSSLVPSPSLGMVVASTKLKCKDAYFPMDAELSVDLKEVLRQLLAGVNFEPEAYEENLADALALAAKIGAVVAPQDIPEKRLLERKRSWGIARSRPSQAPTVVVDGDRAGISHIAEAARLAESLLSPADAYLGPA
jgi:hypothetical protein